MASSKVRQSSFRHIYGKPFQQADIYRDVRHGSLSVDAIPLKVNARYFAVPYVTNGSICAVDMEKQKGSALCHETLGVFCHPEKEQCLDFAFSPHNDSSIASVHQDGAVFLWTIPEGGLKESTTTPTTKFQNEKRTLNVVWHPFAENILTTVDSVKTGIVWDVAAEKEALRLPKPFKGLVTSLSWSGDGTSLAATSKDKKLRVLDVRGSECVGEVECHSGVKAATSVWMADSNQILTAGFTRARAREVAIWDPRNLAKELSRTQVDASSSSSLIPIYDSDLSVLYLGGKGEGTIRTYEVAEGAIHSLSDYKDVDPATGLAAMPKSVVNVKECEVLRMVRLTPKNHVIPLRFEIPRSDNHFFQEDLFPDTWDGKPALSGSEWLGGANGTINKVPMKPADFD